MGLITKKAQEYLDKCRVITPLTCKEGIIVASNSDGYEIVRLFKTADGFDEETLGEFSLFDFFDQNRSKMVLKFKSTVSDIVGRKKYYIEKNIHDFLSDDNSLVDLEYDGIYECMDNAEERAKREAEEEEAAEEAFDAYLKANDM